MSGQRKLRAVFMRGGTSKGVILRQEDLPPSRGDWAPILLAIMGSPDPNGRQLDGMGGGVSSLSKICIVGAPSVPGADVDYTFAQIAIGDANVDYTGNCGNMSSAIGPFAVDEGLVPPPEGGNAVVRIHNTNTGKIIVARFPVVDGAAAVDGTLAIDGVAGTGAPIRLEFADPAGSKTGKLLPTGRAVDMLTLPSGETLEASLVDAANPMIFVAASSLGLSGAEPLAAMERDRALIARLDALREAGAVAMGIARDLDHARSMPAVPKVVLVAPPAEIATLDGRTIPAADMDILTRTVSLSVPHRAIPLTGALCLAVAARIPGSVPRRMLGPAAGSDGTRIGHPSGTLLVGADIRSGPQGVSVPGATVYRTARRLFQGEVFYRAGHEFADPSRRNS